MFRRFSIFLFIGGFFVSAFPAHAASSVVINEIQTGGVTSDDEFIELWNASDASLALEDWSLQYKTATGATITKRNFDKGAVIPAQGYYLIATKDYKGSTVPDLAQSTVSMAKSGGNVFLVRNQEVVTGKNDPDIVDAVAWGTGDSAEGSSAPTPEAGQSIARTDGTDTNNNASDFTLQSTPSPQNTKTMGSGGSTVPSTETPAPPASSSTATDTPAPPKTAEEKAAAKKEKKGRPSFSEILPNPVGSDEEEFIELTNTGDAPLTLAGWKLTNRLNQIYTIKEGTLAPKEYLVLARKKTDLALQNDHDEVKLFAPDNTRAVDTVKYANAQEGEALAETDGDFVWTTAPTPGEANVITPRRQPPHIEFTAPKEGSVGDVLNFDASDSFDPEGEALTFHWNFGDDYGKTEGGHVVYIYLKPGKFTVALTVADKEGLTATETRAVQVKGENLLAEKTAPTYSLSAVEGIKKESLKGSSLSQQDTIPRNDKKLTSGTIRGVVTVPPGVLAKTFMYIQCDEPCAGEGVKIRMTKADWPAIQKGDVITVAGKTSTTGNEPSFLTRKEWMRVTERREPVEPRAVTIKELDDTSLNQFIEITGDVTDKKSGILYLDDGVGEIPVQVKSSTQFIAEGDKASATGILTKNEKGWLLKASEPIVVVNAEPKKTNASLTIVHDAKSDRMKYLVTTLAALLAIAGRPVFLFVQKRRKKEQV